jgi:hypothetical protein
MNSIIIADKAYLQGPRYSITFFSYAKNLCGWVLPWDCHQCKYCIYILTTALVHAVLDENHCNIDRSNDVFVIEMNKSDIWLRLQCHITLGPLFGGSACLSGGPRNLLPALYLIKSGMVKHKNTGMPQVFFYIILYGPSLIQHLKSDRHYPSGTIIQFYVV